MVGMEWAPLAGALVGFVVGLTGVGGGALMAPILLIAFKVDLATVVATDLLFATVTKLVASGVHSKNQLVDWQITKRLWLGSIPPTLLIVTLAYTGMLFESPDWILQLLAALIIFSGVSMLVGDKLQAHQRIKRTGSPERFLKLQPSATTLSGLILGSLVSLTSIGAGALGAVFLRALYPLRMTPAKLVATDTLHAIPVSLIAGIGYLITGFTDLTLLGFLLLGSIPAAYIGSRFTYRLPSEVLKVILACVLILSGMKLIDL